MLLRRGLCDLLGTRREFEPDWLSRTDSQVPVVSEQFLACDASFGANERDVCVVGEFTVALETRDLLCQIGNALGRDDSQDNDQKYRDDLFHEDPPAPVLIHQDRQSHHP